MSILGLSRFSFSPLFTYVRGSVAPSSIEDLKSIYIIGDYSKGIDSGNIEIHIEGKINNKEYIDEIIKKTEKKINRRIEIVDNIDPFEDKLLIYESR